MSRYFDEQRYARNGKSGKGSGQAQKSSPNWFFPFTPTKEQREEIVRMAVEEADLRLPMIQKAVEAGYKVSLKWNTNRNAVQLTITGDEESDFNAGKCLACYHVDVDRVLTILVYALTNQFPIDQEWSKAQGGFDDAF